MESRQLFPGHFVRAAIADGALHRVGGQGNVKGALCLQCNRQLTQYLLLDTCDPYLHALRDCAVRLPLMYCMRCTICCEDFTYRVQPDGGIEIMASHSTLAEGTMWADEQCALSSTMPVSLVPMPRRLQALYDVFNATGALSDAETAEVAAITGSFARAEVGGYPILDAITQVGGRALLIQRAVDPECPLCALMGEARQMYFLASVVQDDTIGLVVPGGCQVVFWYCPICISVTVMHFM